MLSVGGVPEHFNLPWRLAHNSNFWSSHDVRVTFKEQPGGTGEMLARLDDGSLDVAVLLSEGIVRAIAGGLKASICSLYIESPLRWGIHVSGGSSRRSERGLKGARFAITRHGSGSHLMAYVLMERLGFPLHDEQLVKVGSLEGARRALKRGDADVLLWDQFMLARLCDDGELACIGLQPTPWPSFAVAARDAVDPREVRRAAQAIAELAQTLRQDPRVPQFVTREYGLRPQDTDAWLKTTLWSAGDFASADLSAIRRSLKGLGLI